MSHISLTTFKNGLFVKPSHSPPHSNPNMMFSAPIISTKAPVPADLYDDVENNSWYGKAAMIIGYNNIFNISDRKFKPHEAVTRAEAASAIADSFAAKKLSVVTTMMWPDYIDTTNLTQKQQSDISFVFNTSIMRYTGNEFRPDEKITRTELATILNQTLKTLAAATPAQEAEPGSSPVSGNPAANPPDVNTAAFKDQGDLAFVRQGLLYTLDGETGEVKQLTESGRVLQPAWSHDGQWLAYIRITDQEADNGNGLLWLVRRDGSQAHQVQGLLQLVSRERFYWSPAAIWHGASLNGSSMSISCTKSKTLFQGSFQGSGFTLLLC